jgi:hypothetical protein
MCFPEDWPNGADACVSACTAWNEDPQRPDGCNELDEAKNLCAAALSCSDFELWQDSMVPNYPCQAEDKAIDDLGCG